jgi:hypothetical protein
MPTHAAYYPDTALQFASQGSSGLLESWLLIPQEKLAHQSQL